MPYSFLFDAEKTPSGVKSPKREIVVCGGASMILNKYNREQTQDIDIVKPVKDQLLQEIAAKIAKESMMLREN